MTKNIGRLDQVIRILISLILIYIGFINKQMINDPFSSNIIGSIGILSLVVAVVRICPLYILAGINTCKNKEK